jgi:hypothetical protein
MDDTASIREAEQPARTESDEQLMVAFSRGSMPGCSLSDIKLRRWTFSSTFARARCSPDLCSHEVIF